MAYFEEFWSEYSEWKFCKRPAGEVYSCAAFSLENHAWAKLQDLQDSNTAPYEIVPI